MTGSPEKTTSPIQTLPPELLALIFEHAHADACTDLHDTWSTLTRGQITSNALSLLFLLSSLSSTCPSWGELARNLPELWTVIPLLDLYSQPFALKEFIDRSASLPLTLLVDMGRNNPKITRLAFRLLSLSGAFARVERMTVILAGRGSDAYMCGKMFQSLCLHEFPALRELTLADGSLHLRAEEWAWLVRHSENLESLDLGLIDELGRTRSAPIPASPPQLPLNKLKQLRLHIFCWHDLLPTLRTPLPELKELHIGAKYDPYHALIPRQVHQGFASVFPVLLGNAWGLERLVWREYMFDPANRALEVLVDNPGVVPVLKVLDVQGGMFGEEVLRNVLEKRGGLCDPKP